ncbi:26S proteasome regulatory subunit N1 [Puccinia graminis f. sp. tritici CRL 75-36-700-3]|uniref:26S proteasome regulatory subunit RPN1 n=1 Tax=Puccinia graminis f. sp. tritici (strain CRL 75-36-700-3 / race SCCL) TaxID=418459 RepID=H6QSF8_PUCGT|nr:26S proteasome regulatory subunit N1 [Puccinia graminis f. sp. tritici CRL 75-36-700-3]EHS63688.1 26S proteasome regulatory subunit N1 [Puccinia graminis f. sp. tritici CRL 75-36-700-3]
MAKDPKESLVAPVRSDDVKPSDKKKSEDGLNGKQVAKKLNDNKTHDQELSEEDTALKEELEMLVQRLKESDRQLYKPTLEMLRSLIRTSTSSMTSVPKPLKFLRPHFGDLVRIFYSWGSREEYDQAMREDGEVKQEIQRLKQAEKATAAAAAAAVIPSSEPEKKESDGETKPDESKTKAKEVSSGSKNNDGETTLNRSAAVPALPPFHAEPGSVKGVSSMDRILLAEIISVLAMTYSDSGLRDTLAFRLRSHKVDHSSVRDDPGVWGHEYVRHLAAEIAEAYQAVQSKSDDMAEDERIETDEQSSRKKELHQLAMLLVPFLLSHNGEADAIDLLLELESINDIVPLVAEHNYSRVCNYMLSCVNFLVPPDDTNFLRACRQIYRSHSRFSESMMVNIKMGDKAGVKEDFESASNPNMKLQLAHLLARHQLPYLSADLTEDEDLNDVLNNTKLTAHFKAFGENLNVTEPKTREDIYKSHLENIPASLGIKMDSAKQNLAGTFVNAFVNAGFGNDPLMANAEGGQSWIYKNKDDGMMSAAASLGVSLLWDTDGGISQIDKYTYATDDHIKAGALLANGLLHSGVRTEMDVALALLADHIDSAVVPIRVSAIIGIGIAYAGTHRDDIMDLLLPRIEDTAVSMEIAGVAALALGFIFVGSGDGNISRTILQTMMERENDQLNNKWSRYLGLGLALLYLGQQDSTESADATIETLKAIEHPLSKQTLVLLESCLVRWVGNGTNEEEANKEEEKDGEEVSEQTTLHQQLAVIGIAVIAMGEEVGAEMSLRHFGHLMQYGEAPIRRAVPLALGLVSVSDPVLPVLDTLSKYSHDSDLGVALNSIFAMGLVGAGTNNARLAQMLRQLSTYYYKEPDCLFMVRVAQGLVHLGKGTLGLGPFHCDRQVMSPVAVAALLSTIMAFTDAKSFILDKAHWLLFLLTPAMYPRFLMTFGEDGKAIETSVRVGQAVNIVGQAGKPKSISGFQTHVTPVRLGNTERAELASEEFIPYAHVLEGLVILSKNPGFESETMIS